MKQSMNSVIMYRSLRKWKTYMALHYPRESQMEMSEEEKKSHKKNGNLMISFSLLVSVEGARRAPIAIFILQMHKQSHLQTVTSLNFTLCLVLNTSSSQQTLSYMGNSGGFPWWKPAAMGILPGLSVSGNGTAKDIVSPTPLKHHNFNVQKALGTKKRTQLHKKKNYDKKSKTRNLCVKLRLYVS